MLRAAADRRGRVAFLGDRRTLSLFYTVQIYTVQNLKKKNACGCAKSGLFIESKKKNTCSLPCAGLAFLGGFAVLYVWTFSRSKRWSVR